MRRLLFLPAIALAAFRRWGARPMPATAAGQGGGGAA